MNEINGVTRDRDDARTRAPTRRSQAPLLSCRLACPSGCGTHTHARSHGRTRMRAHEHALHCPCLSPAARPLSASSRSVPSPCSLSLGVCPLSETHPQVAGSVLERACLVAGDGVQRPHEPPVRRVLSLRARARARTHTHGHMSALARTDTRTDEALTSAAALLSTCLPLWV